MPSLSVRDNATKMAAIIMTIYYEENAFFQQWTETNMGKTKIFFIYATNIIQNLTKQKRNTVFNTDYTFSSERKQRDGEKRSAPKHSKKEKKMTHIPTK